MHRPSPLWLNNAYRRLNHDHMLLQHLVTKGLGRPNELPNSEFISELIGDLLQKLPPHFKSEELFFAAISHPDLKSQHEANSNLLEELTEICYQLMLGDARTTHTLQEFLKRKLQNHLLTMNERCKVISCPTLPPKAT